METSWQSLLTKAVSKHPRGQTLAAFNLNVDVVARATPEAIERLVGSEPSLDWEAVAAVDVPSLRSIQSREQFVAVLRHGFETGKSNLLVRDDEAIVSWWEELFHDRAESMGGQAGIIANQMAALGADSVVYSPLLSIKQARLFLGDVLWPRGDGDAVVYEPAAQAGRASDPTREPWVFEFAKGVEYNFPDRSITTPRANRVIITTGIQGPDRRFHPDIHPWLSKLGEATHVGFLAGYHQCGPNPDDPEAVRAYLRSSVDDLALLRANNPQLKLHLEYVPAKAKHMEVECYRSLCSQMDSFGINETESRSFLERLGCGDIAEGLAQHERAYLLYQGALAMMERLGVERVHVHNLGYYVLVLKKPYHRSWERVRDACLFASAVNALKAKEGGFPRAESLGAAARMRLSEVGFEQLRGFASEALKDEPGDRVERFLNEGILERDDHVALVIPAHIVDKPIVTVGMGDTISSSAYLYETCAGSED